MCNSKSLHMLKAKLAMLEIFIIWAIILKVYQVKESSQRDALIIDLITHIVRWVVYFHYKIMNLIQNKFIYNYFKLYQCNEHSLSNLKLNLEWRS